MSYKIVPTNLKGKFVNKEGETVVLDSKDFTENRKGTKTKPPFTRVLKAASQKDLKYAYHTLGMRELIQIVDDKPKQRQITSLIKLKNN